ncbi:MAG TPA: tyrosine-protein phosphatase [Acidimicrobiales bacterium]|nr:tyrosine-protein phosphatase [Acidimicrobiales bacterium]
MKEQSISTGPSRHVELQGCCNFRDLGGYPTADGHRTRWRRLFRADGLTQLTEEDLASLAELGVRNVIDLRTDIEVESRGRFTSEAEGVVYHHLPLTDTLPGAEQGAAWDDTGFVTGRYLSMLRDGTSSVTTAVALLSDPASLPAVFHCSVGKDRTGVLAAVVLGLLGVPDEVIVEDYALSAAAMAQVLERLELEFPDSQEIVQQYAPAILSVEPASMTGFLAGVRQHYGSFEGLATGLGIEEPVQRLRAALLEPA